jgi:hypothetical protein
MANGSIPNGFADNGDERSSSIKAVAIIFILLSWIFVGLRCYVRVFITKLFRVDDWLAVATLVRQPYSTYLD